VNTSTWPQISYFHEGTRQSREIKAQLKLIESQNWRDLYRATDGTYWRLDAYDKYQTRYLLRIDDLDTWWQFDSTALEKELLRQSRSESPNRRCRWINCENPALHKLEICVDHAYSQGLRE
jgi:hypothetical protein